jgi:4,5-DOPA dioxygenase extradiol
LSLVLPVDAAVAESDSRPRAILLMSPHWMTRELTVAASAAPATLYDFSGFAPQLKMLRYPAPGSAWLSQRVVELAAAVGVAVRLDPTRGLDHGAWVPLRYLFPEASVPVVQLALPASLDGHSAFALGRMLSPLSNEGVLSIGSGSLTHNLADFFTQAASGDLSYVEQFTHWARAAVRERDYSALTDYLRRAPQAARAHPSAEHFLPLPFAAGAAAAEATPELLDGGTDHGVLSMDAFLFGAAASSAPA